MLTSGLDVTAHVQDFGLTTNLNAQACVVKMYPADPASGLIQLEKNETLFGRGENCDLVLENRSVSRRHAVLENLGDGYRLRDLNSTNGTYINEVRVTGSRVFPGDRIRLGNHIFKFLLSDEIEVQYHETLYSMVTRDPLTNAFNKRYFREMLERELSRAERHHRSVALIMLDLDHFKAVNDEHGHLTGDRVLSEVCSRIQKELRGDEVFARFGGEEFAVLLNELSEADAVTVAERCRQTIEQTPCEVNDNQIPVTISLGVAVTSDGECNSADDLIEAADAKLYQAKTQGRNCVCS